MNVPAARAAALAASLLLAACSSLGAGKDELPAKPPPLADMEEPVALHEEPQDEAARAALPLGSFTGVAVVEVRRSLEESVAATPGVRVARVIENSPGDAAGIEEDDLLVEASVDGGAPHVIRWPSEWRKLELETAPGASLSVVLDRAGVERTATIRPTPRVRPPDRAASERFREEKRTGVVLRTATEVEARAAGLGPGGGAVVVGLSAQSPWRAAGLRFEDLIVAAGGKPLGHPHELLETIRAAKPDEKLALTVVRGGAHLAIEAPLSRREQTLRTFSIPFVVSYESSRGTSETSILAGAVRTRSTAAAWEWRILWLLTFSGGDADRLIEVQE